MTDDHDPGGLAATDAIELGDLDRLDLDPEADEPDPELLDAGELGDLEDAAP